MKNQLLHSLRGQIIISIILTVIISLGIFQFYIYQSLKEEFLGSLNIVADQKIERLKRDMDLPLWELDEEWIKKIIYTEMLDDRVYGVSLKGDSNIDIEKKKDFIEPCSFATDSISKECILRTAPILHNRTKIGEIKLYISKVQMNKNLKDDISRTIWLSLILMVTISGILLFVINILIVNPLGYLLSATQRIAHGEYDFPMPSLRGDEVGLLGKSIEEMKSKIQIREEELMESQSELQQANDTLEFNVTERTMELVEANKKLKELDRLKSMFIASMSHELRTPLNSIIGFTGVMLQGMSGPLNDKQTDQLSRVKSAGQHLLSLIGDVIDISKIEAGRVTPFAEPFLLNDLLREAYKEIEVLAKAKGLELRLEEMPEIQMDTDRKRLYQCLLNYLSNAVKFSESGEIILHAQEEDGKVRIWVKDSGIGIEEKDRSHVFEAFERFETHLRVLPGGTGLGLYLTRKITEELLEGSVWYESKVGEGSIFGLLIPKKIIVSEEA